MNNNSNKTPKEWLDYFELLNRKLGSGDVNIANARQTAEEIELQATRMQRHEGDPSGRGWMVGPGSGSECRRLA
ncbi:hypothetical protein [Anatilimnocola aggregata]|uniref:hypothetical protein n=1 Tax=Anatilimnocola aggregata TaxID=2528021 RepID=UPI0011A12654|nr:hypothetical protein [Anatilimnocola aggregata]